MPPEGKHPSLPPASPDGCAHEHLAFEDGQFHVVCIDCRKHWAALTHRGGPPDYNMAGKIMFQGRHTRHDRYILPRTLPLDSPITQEPPKYPLRRK